MADYKTKELKERNQSDKEYAESMAQAIQRAGTAKPKPVKPEGMSKEEWYASMQSPSTQAILLRDPSKDEEHFNRLLDVDRAQVEKSGEEVVINAEKRIADYGMAQINHLEAVRRRAKNSLGQSKQSATDKETKDSAVHHFLVSPPAKLTKEEEKQVTQLSQPQAVVAQPQLTKEVWVEMTWYQALVHWLKGNKIEKRDEHLSSWRDYEKDEE